MITNLKEISNFMNKNNSYSDFNLVNDLLLNLNFTKINFKKNLTGGYETHKTPKITETPKILTFTIKKGTILFHSSKNKKGFNTNNLNLNNNTFNLFTPNFKLASDKIDFDNEDKSNGYIYVYKVIKNIPNIYIGLETDIYNAIISGKLENEFEHQTQEQSPDKHFNGIGIFYPINPFEMCLENSNQYTQSQSQSQILDNLEQYYSEFCLSNPDIYMEKISQFMYWKK